MGGGQARGQGSEGGAVAGKRWRQTGAGAREAQVLWSEARGGRDGKVPVSKGGRKKSDKGRRNMKAM